MGTSWCGRSGALPCEPMRLLIHAGLDGELDAAHAAELERHLADCAGCSQEQARLQSLRATLRKHATRHRLPDSARSDLLARLPREQPTASVAVLPRFRANRRRALGAIAAALVAGIALDRAWQ